MARRSVGAGLEVAGRLEPVDQVARRRGGTATRDLSLLVDHGLFFHPDQHAQLKHHLPAYTVGSLRTNGQVECLVNVIESLLSSGDPQGQLHHVTHALHEMVVFGRSKKHMIQRQWGRLEPTADLQYRADEVMRNILALST